MDRSRYTIMVQVWTLFLTIGLASCSVSHAPMVHPSRLSLSIDLETILDNLDSYRSYFCARSFNPSALMFVPHASPFTVIPEKRGLGEGWSPVEDRAAILQMIGTIRDRDRLSHPALKALVRPLDQGGSPQAKDVLGFIFSSASTFARPLEGAPRTYKVYQIPEIPRMGEHDKRWLFWGNGLDGP
ncbi:hypothetical protein [Desulfoplanes sp.]